MSVAVFDTIESVQLWLADKRVSQQRVAFVPTMGALHPGHVSLIKQARQMADVVVSSIFVNPTQFNNPADLLKYPRTLDADIAMLEEAGCDVVFTPDVAEIYPTISKSHWDFGLLSSRLEGQFRPGHFDGVCTVVKRLFEIVQPNLALFGEKDFQQLAIIRKLVEYEGMPIEISGCRTMREADGLAMSSRNLRLTTKQRQQARAISQTLFWMQQNR
ncbi:MAG: pantoate--beta-alanine ligase, partial [Flavobacteriales bacterium]